MGPENHAFHSFGGRIIAYDIPANSVTASCPKVEKSFEDCIYLIDLAPSLRSQGT